MSAGALVRSGDKSAMQTVRDLLENDDPQNSGIAAWVLGQIGDRSDIPRLTKQLARCPDAATRASFEHALAIIGDEVGLKALERNLTSDDNAIRTYAATFAGDARASNTVPPLKAMLEDPFADARIRAAQSLLVLAGTAIVPLKVEADPKLCWFPSHVATLPDHGKEGCRAGIMTSQEHLGSVTMTPVCTICRPTISARHGRARQRSPNSRRNWLRISK